MNLHTHQIGTSQAYQELIRILRKPYQDVCVTCDGRGKLSTNHDCQHCKGSGNRWLRLI